MSKIRDYTAATAPVAGTAVAPITVDPSGTPLSRKLTLDEIRKFLDGAGFTWAPTASPDVSAVAELKSTDTSDATPVSLVTDVTHADETLVRYSASVDARDEFGNAYVADIRAVYERTDGTLRLVSAPVVTTVVNEIGCAATIDNPSGATIRLKGTGVADTDIRWSATLDRTIVALEATPAVFDIDALAWNLAFAGPYSGVPHAGVVTAGDSGDYHLESPINDPDVGAALNGIDTFDLDGVDQACTPYDSGPVAIKWGDIASAGAYKGMALVKIRSAAAAAGAIYNNAQIIADNGGNIGVAIASDGAGGVQLAAFHYDGGWVATGWKVTTLNAWHLVEWWHDGADLHLAVDGVEATSVATTNAESLGAITVCIGRNHDASKFADMLLAEIRMAPDDEIASSEDLIEYSNDTYGLSL